MKQNKSSKPDNRLPNKLWELLQVAIMDLTLAEMNPKYRIDMGQVHTPNGSCKVCLAGSVMAAMENHTSYKTDLNELPYSFSGDFDSIDDCRGYNFGRAIENKCGASKNKAYSVENEIRNAIIDECSYRKNPELFKANMETAAATLKKYDL